jgi:pyruvate,orthophosphate dikinase
MYADVVLWRPSSDFEHSAESAKDDERCRERRRAGRRNASQPGRRIQIACSQPHRLGVSSNPTVQLWGAIEAVWKSWTLKKARDYRRVNGISEELGTAVSVVAMVFGNLGDDSGQGVAFTRNPSTGERKFYGGVSDERAGRGRCRRDPYSARDRSNAERLPTAYRDLLRTQERLEKHYADMQDLEFTVERGNLFLLQTRTGKRTAAAAVRIAHDMVG